MAHMFGFIGNRADLGARLLEHHKDLLRVKRGPHEALGWGVGGIEAEAVMRRLRFHRWLVECGRLDEFSA